MNAFPRTIFLSPSQPPSLPPSLPLPFIPSLSFSDHAKLLWQRIPKTVKQEHRELSELWEIGKRLWRKEFAAIYELTRNPKWPSHIEPLITTIVGKMDACPLYFSLLSPAIWPSIIIPPSSLYLCPFLLLSRTLQSTR